MGSIVENLAVIEKEVGLIQPRISPLVEKIEALNQKIETFTKQLAEIGAEAASIQQEVGSTQQGFAKIQSLIAETRSESEQFVAGQEENQQRCETMTAVFGEAFQVVSRFLATAQKMGLVEPAQAEPLLTSPPVLTPSPAEPEPVVPAREEEVVQGEEPESQVSACEEEFSAISDADFVSVITPAAEIAKLSLPGLPDVAAPPALDDDVETGDPTTVEGPTEEAEESTNEIASELDLPPLLLDTPTSTEEPDTDEENEQQIEDMLTDMLTPVTTG
jgi:regulator of replication initiation timing